MHCLQLATTFVMLLGQGTYVGSNKCSAWIEAITILLHCFVACFISLSGVQALCISCMPNMFGYHLLARLAPHLAMYIRRRLL